MLLLKELWTLWLTLGIPRLLKAIQKCTYIHKLAWFWNKPTRTVAYLSLYVAMQWVQSHQSAETGLFVKAEAFWPGNAAFVVMASCLCASEPFRCKVIHWSIAAATTTLHLSKVWSFYTIVWWQLCNLIEVFCESEGLLAWPLGLLARQAGLCCDGFLPLCIGAI